MHGYWLLVLHSHLPFVKHPEYDYFLEEHWLFEAITECYVPLLKYLRQLEANKIDFRLTISMTPPLCEMLRDPILIEKYQKHLDRMIELSSKEIKRTSYDYQLNKLSLFYRDLFQFTKHFLEDLNWDILKEYKRFKELGFIEITTCGATHGFLPFMSFNEKAVRAQIEIAVNNYNKHFGCKPEGIWLPECAYYKGLDKILDEYGIRYFFTDTHGVIFGKPKPRYGVYAPVYTESGVAVFARDFSSSKQVWSSKEGYPGDFDYRDFYRDIGFDLEYDYIKPYICPDGTRVFTGIKYHRVTGTSDYKEYYIREHALAKVEQHAKHFLKEREKQVLELTNYMDRKPLVVSPYDAELFGHWWFEGPEFLYNLFRFMSKSNVVKAITPMEYLNEYNTNQVLEINPSSWGDKGYYGVWLNEGNEWIYKHLKIIADKMVDYATRFKHSSDPNIQRVLNQMARELLLAQSSDWAFLMTTRTATEYATLREKEHIFNFLKLENMLNTEIDFEYLTKLEHKNSIFQEMDFRIYSK
ncbi:MAG: DUF1957 domain-containing protein [Calditerrivibrio sp.]|nr:DUF1957 domain-containing protein [Calditerrivibrio sp.]